MRLLTLFIIAAAFALLSIPVSAHEIISISPFGLEEGDIIGASLADDPDIYIVNEYGYKRLFLSPKIFSFYRHLRWENVKNVSSYARNTLETSNYFRNCESNDPRVYVLEVLAEDSARLRWINIAADAALSGDHDFFKKVFCVNNQEFNSYAKGISYTSLADIPRYDRAKLLGLGVDRTDLSLSISNGFNISRFVNEDIGPVRFMAFSSDGILFVTMPSEGGLYKSGGRSDGKVLALPDKDNDGIADNVITVISNLRLPHGIAFHNNYLYIAEESKISRYPYLGNAAIGSRETIISNLPTGGHISRTIGFNQNGKLYISVGSSCNNCEETDNRQAAILEYNADGSGGRVFASGLRNSVGFVFHPYFDEMWATDNGRDYLGDDLPPDEINIVRENKHYGWPYCYGVNVVDPAFNKSSFCQTVEKSVFDIQAHSAALGLRFIQSSQFSQDWQGDLLVAYHGSWNRAEPTGYKIVRLDVEGNKITGQYDFIAGWLRSDGIKTGRPVDVIFDSNGAMYISDDFANTIYKVAKL